MKTSLRFNQWNGSELMSTGPKSACFWEMLGGALTCACPAVNRAKFGQAVGAFTQSTFLSNGKVVE